MAKIRTIKPEFFTSDDICALSVQARLLYIGIWCEADREGRLEWRPGNLKRRYLPDDRVNIVALCNELISRGLVVLYADGLAYIPTFNKHQHINPRETASKLPNPNASATREPRVTDATATREPRDSDAQGGREGKGMEWNGKEQGPRTPRGERLPDDWRPSADMLAWAAAERPDIDVQAETENFRDHWLAKSGRDAAKLDWGRTWKKWIRSAFARPKLRAVGGYRPEPGEL